MRIVPIHPVLSARKKRQQQLDADIAHQRACPAHVALAAAIAASRRDNALRLAELTGLTTGAITGVIDRLEKAGLVRRERDDSDRRKVFIAVVPESEARIGKFYESLQQSIHKAWSKYSDDELRFLIRFTMLGYDVMRSATEGLKEAEAPSLKKKPPA